MTKNKGGQTYRLVKDPQHMLSPFHANKNVTSNLETYIGFIVRDSISPTTLYGQLPLTFGFISEARPLSVGYTMECIAWCSFCRYEGSDGFENICRNAGNDVPIKDTASSS